MPDRSVVSSNLIQTITELRTAKSTQKSANTSRNEFAFALTQISKVSFRIRNERQLSDYPFEVVQFSRNGRYKKSALIEKFLIRTRLSENDDNRGTDSFNILH